MYKHINLNLQRHLGKIYKHTAKLFQIITLLQPMFYLILIYEIAISNKN